MNKTLQWAIGISVIFIAAAVVFSTVWPFFAPSTGWAGYGPGMMGGQGMMRGQGMMSMTNSSLSGPMHNAMFDVLAQSLGLSRSELDSRLASGETLPQIATANGISAADFASLTAQAHQAVLDRAVADGYLTQEQATWMLTMTSGYGNCPFNGMMGTVNP